ncbi:MAG: NAD(P)/FAD-dependent oxidoreductase [Leptospirillia bacterium]
MAREESNGTEPYRVLVLGAGFGGLYTAVLLSRRLGKRAPHVWITVVDRQNYFLFTPMLHSVATGALEPRYVAHSIRKIFRKTRVHAHVGQIERIDLENRQVITAHRALPYDELVISLGSETNFFGNRDLERRAFTLKSLEDAARINNHLIRQFERAYWEEDPEIKRALLTFVVVGGGPTGVELAGEIYEYAVRELLRDFGRRIERSFIRVVLLEATGRILPSLAEPLSTEAIRRLVEIGIEVRLETRLESWDGETVRLSSGESLAARTLIWAAGVKTNPLVRELPLDRDPQGRIVVRSTLESKSMDHVWVLGDNAHAVDPFEQRPYPPTAQTAVRQARVVAHNIAARILKRPERTFAHHHVGGFVSIGDNYALLSAKQFTLTGFLGWFLWNLVYIHKLPIVRYRLFSTFGLLLKVFFERATTEIDLCPKEPQRDGGLESVRERERRQAG